jgi:hypothetical protein
MKHTVYLFEQLKPVPFLPHPWHDLRGIHHRTAHRLSTGSPYAPVRCNGRIGLNQSYWASPLYTSVPLTVNSGCSRMLSVRTSRAQATEKASVDEMGRALTPGRTSVGASSGGQLLPEMIEIVKGSGGSTGRDVRLYYDKVTKKSYMSRCPCLRMIRTTIFQSRSNRFSLGTRRLCPFESTA